MKKQRYDRMPTDNGRIKAYYLRNHNINFIEELSIEYNKSPSETLRLILSDFEEIRFLIKKRLIK
jgi:hypothetical protein